MMLEFIDRRVTYGQFVNDLADALNARQRKPHEPEYICQNEAFRRFGKANVLRWRHTGKIIPCKRIQKLEYKISELQRLKDIRQDYFSCSHPIRAGR